MRISSETALILIESEDRELMSRAGPANWAKGTALLSSGKLVSVEEAEEAQTWTARVRDRGLAYRTWVRVLPGKVELSCACPIGQDCAHAVALLLALRDEARSVTHESAPWRARLAPLVGGRGARGEPLALLVNAAEHPDEILLEPLRRGTIVPWTRKRASWPDLVSTQWASVTEGIDPVHLALMREGYSLSRKEDAWHSRNEVRLSSLGAEALGWLRRLAREGVALFASLEDFAPLGLDTITWDLGLDLKALDSGMRLDRLATNGEERIVHPRIDEGAGLIVLDGGARLGALSGTELLKLVPAQGLAIPAEDVADFTTAFLPVLKRQFPIVSVDSSVDLASPPPVRLVATLRLEDARTLLVRWWAEFDCSGTASRILLQRALDAPGVADLAARIDVLGRAAAPRGLWEPGPATLRLPGWRIPEYLDRVVSVIDDPDLVWDVDEAVSGAQLDAEPLVMTVDMADRDSDWFGLKVRLDVGGVEVPLAEVLRALAEGEDHLLVSGRWVSLDGPRFEALAALLAEARALSDEEEPAIAPLHLGLWREIEELADHARATREWQDRVRGLSSPAEVEIAPPAEVELRPYQREGVEWLASRAGAGLGAILADDMGLGKTLQILTAIASTRPDPEAPPVLVVAPTSVVPTWKHEAQRFFPGLRVRLVGETRRRRGSPLSEAAVDADILVTSYTIARLEAEEWAESEFSGLVLDEAQAAKNPRTAIYKALRSLRTPWAFAVTGTPVENSLSDLWALLSLTDPGLLPSWTTFTQAMRKPIEDEGDEEALARLHRLVAPFMLRRTKEEVASDLPDKVETLVHIDLGAEHRRIYEQALMRERAKILDLAGDSAKRIDLLASITRLRQLALDPALVDPAYGAAGSAKIEYLADALDEIVPRGHRALVFSQFTSFLARIRDVLERRGVRVVQLDGSTRDREGVIDDFCSGRAPVFLISLKAGGTGLTLTEADYVYVMDPWWNPAAEAQAVDRAHRIGQEKKVNVYRLVAADTIEDRVVALQERKRALVTSVVEGAGAASGLNVADLAALLD